MNIHPLKNMPRAIEVQSMQDLIKIHEDSMGVQVSYLNEMPRLDPIFSKILMKISKSNHKFLYGCEWKKAEQSPALYYDNFTIVSQQIWSESIQSKLKNLLGITALEARLFVEALLEDFYITKELLLNENQSGLIYLTTRRQRPESWHRDSFTYAAVKNYIGDGTLYALPESFCETDDYHQPDLIKKSNVFQLQTQGMALHKGGSVNQPTRGMGHRAPWADKQVNRIVQFFLVNEIVN
jgi:hypothetical protein